MISTTNSHASGLLFRASLLAFCSFVPPGVAGDLYAGDLYVNNVSGDDTRDGTAAGSLGAQGGPLRTIARALQKANQGDRIILAKTEEPYRESLTLQAGKHSGVPGRPFELIGNGAILDGTQPVPADAWEQYAGDVYRFRPARLSCFLLYKDGLPAKRRAVSAGALEPPQLAPLEWCLFRGRVHFRAEKGRLPQRYDLTHTVLPVGITLYEVRDVVIRDLVVQGYRLDGINAHDGVFGATLAGLNCRGNGRSGISVGGASRVSLESSLLGNNGTAQLRTEGSSLTERSCFSSVPYSCTAAESYSKVSVDSACRSSESRLQSTSRNCSVLYSGA